MIITWDLDKGILRVGSTLFPVVSDVRNELNGRRQLHLADDVVRAIVDGQWGDPYMPRPFPRGGWYITCIDIIEDPKSEFYPVKIRTDATQRVRTWALDADGGYDHPSEKYVIDSGYHLHWDAWSKTTLGCGRVGKDSAADVLRLAGMLWDKRDRRQIRLEVV